jgi:hypothetical protein
MSEDIIKPGNNGKLEPEPQRPQAIVMTITLSPEGNLSVQAPGNGQLYDLPMALYMMELAKDHVKAVNKAKGQSPIIQARPRIKDIFRKY